jgi:hypothetical protein
MKLLFSKMNIEHRTSNHARAWNEKKEQKTALDEAQFLALTIAMQYDSLF